MGPFPSEDGEALQAFVPGRRRCRRLGDARPRSWTTCAAQLDDAPDGLDHYVTGPGGYAAESAEAFAGIDGMLLAIAAGVVIVILLFTYRSPVLWILPLFSAGVALTVAQAVVYFAAKEADVTVNGQSASILTVLVFGAGTDYALLLVARYREELRRHEDRHEAMAFALHRAGPAIFASGATVVAGMLCLLLASLNSTSGLGPVSAIGIVVALAVMLTLLPALLVIFGRWIFWPKRPAFGAPDQLRAEPSGAGSGASIAVRPRTTWIVTSLLLAIAALGVTQLDATGLRQSEQFYGKPEAVKGEEVLAEHFPAGSGQPVDVVANAEQADEVATVVAETPGHLGRAGAPGVRGHRLHRGDARGRRRTPRRRATPSTGCENDPRDRGRGRPGRGWHGDLRRHPRRLRPGQPRHPPGGAAGGVPDPGGAAARAAWRR